MPCKASQAPSVYQTCGPVLSAKTMAAVATNIAIEMNAETSHLRIGEPPSEQVAPGWWRPNDRHRACRQISRQATLSRLTRRAPVANIRAPTGTERAPYSGKERSELMAPVAAFHTTSQEYPPTHRNVYHDRSECRYGQEIKRDGKDVLGYGGRLRCDECKRFG